jgi:hypothetical protein
LTPLEKSLLTGPHLLKLAFSIKTSRISPVKVPA